MQKPCFVLFLILPISLFAQWQFGSSFLHTQAQPFSWESESIGDYETSMGLEIYAEYRFAERTREPFQFQDAVRVDWQLLQRQTEGIGSSWIRLPIWWRRTLPRKLNGEGHPIFELNSGVGYYLGKPILMYRTSPSIGFPPLKQTPAYWTHGILADISIAFYIQTGSRFHLGYRFALDLAKTGVQPDDTVQQFSERGFVIGFSSSLPDTKKRMKAVREARKQRRKKRG